jgi:outer membrane protein OmpA-like peptidoglycan-associated protein
MLTAVLSAGLSLGAWAQSESNPQEPIRVEPMEKTPVYRVNVVSRTTKAINYRHHAGKTKVDFKGTSLMPQVSGSATVESRTGRLDINAELERLRPAKTFGPEYLTYVLWAITPEGRAVNLGEVLPDEDGKARLGVTADLQAFGMIVTAEPYFAVTRPSDIVVAENIVRTDTKGGAFPIDARFDALERGEYTIDIRPLELPATTADPKTPANLLEARNAVAIARAAGAEQYAPAALQKAQDFLGRAEDYYRREQGTKAIAAVSRAATQTAEDARVLTIRKKQEERAAAERKAIQERAARARAEADAEAQRRAQAEQARLEAERAQREAQEAAERAAREREQAEAARQAALQQQQQLQSEAERARLAQQQAQEAALRAEQEREQMRARLLEQLNQVLQTRDTAQGLVANMPDVLFDFNKATLRPAARVRLAKLAGIILAYPDLKLRIEGHTDNIGSDQYNQTLSERRAATVRDFLISQGVPVNNAVALGFGKSQPIASNATPRGRQLNRRVDLLVSGEAIGTRMLPGSPGAPASAGGTAGAAAGATGTTTAPPAPPPGSVAAPTTQPAPPAR